MCGLSCAAWAPSCAATRICELAFRRALGVRAARVFGLASQPRQLGEELALVSRVGLDELDQPWNQVVTALELNVHVSPGLGDLVAQAN